MLPLSECFEMESRASHFPPSRNRLVKRVVEEEYDLRDLPQGKAISCWWLTLPVFYYLVVIAGGVIASISVGDVVAAFDNNCIFYAKVTLKDLDSLKNSSKVLTWANVAITTFGDMDYCWFPEYASVASVMYAGILLVMVLQCGRGGGKSAFRGRGTTVQYSRIAESWRIVPVAFVFNLIFLILSSIVFGYIQNGFNAFCNGMDQIGSNRTLGNISRCADVLQFSFPSDKYNTSLYMEFVLSKIGASLQLGGSLMAFLTIVVRCCLPADFIVYRRRKIMMTTGIQSSYDENKSSDSRDSPNMTTTTTVMCHNNSASDTEDIYLNLESGVADDVESVHSGRSDIQLVGQSSSSRPFTTIVKTIGSKSPSQK